MGPRLVFVHGDEPQAGVRTHFDPATLMFTAYVADGYEVQWAGELQAVTPARSSGASRAKRSAAAGASAPDASHGVPTDADVVLLRRVVPAVSSQATLNAPDQHVVGVDFRNKKTRRTYATRLEYGRSVRSSCYRLKTMDRDSFLSMKQDQRVKHRDEAVERIRLEAEEGGAVDAEAGGGGAAPTTDDRARPGIGSKDEKRAAAGKASTTKRPRE